VIFGITGAYAIGKTTFLQNLEIPGIRKVFGDSGCNLNDDLRPIFDNIKYYRTMAGKRDIVEYTIRDHTTLWIVEGCRFWRGSLLQKIRPVIDDIQGGLFMLVIVASPDVMEERLKIRAANSNKKYRADYWDYKRRLYEGEMCATNSCRRNLLDTEWCQQRLTGDFSTWDGVPAELIRQFASDRTLWYDREPMASIKRMPCATHM